MWASACESGWEIGAAVMSDEESVCPRAAASRPCRSKDLADSGSERLEAPEELALLVPRSEKIPSGAEDVVEEEEEEEQECEVAGGRQEFVDPMSRSWLARRRIARNRLSVGSDCLQG